MGEVRVTIGVGIPGGGEFLDVDVIADTGSTFTTVPRTVLEGLGVPVGRRVPSELANGQIVPVDTGTIVIRLQGQEFQTPVIFREEDEPSLLGVIALEQALLAADPHNGRLVPVNAHRYRGRSAR